MTPAQESARMKQLLDAIYERGDQDECSIKHIGHCVAAIATGGTWEDAVDYRRPWDGGSIPKLDAELAKWWAKVQAKFDELGYDRFMEALEGTPYSWYPNRYIPEWYMPEGEERDAIMAKQMRETIGSLIGAEPDSDEVTERLQKLKVCP